MKADHPAIVRTAIVIPTTLLMLAGAAAAQCAQWAEEPASPGGVPGVESAHTSAIWDPDGPGPLPAVVVVGGGMTRAGDVQAEGLAVYDPVARSWSRLAEVINDKVFAVVGMPNGDLVAGGDFFFIDGTFATSIARWNGSSWMPLAAGLDNRVEALAVLPNGDLVAGGYFGSSGGVPMSRVARWDGSSWSPFGAGLNGTVTSLAVSPNGDLFAGGSFSMSGGVSTPRVARWNGVNWQGLGGGTSGDVLSLAVLPNGDLVAGGEFGAAGGASVNAVARWDGAVWHALGNGVTGFGARVETLSVLPGGDLVAGGRFSQAGVVAAQHVARWDGSRWWPLGAGVSKSSGGLTLVQTTVALPGAGLFVAGDFDRAGSTVVVGAASWDGTTWHRTNDGIDGVIIDAIELAQGGLIVGGTFRTIGGVQTNGVARWDGVSWQALGNGLGGLNGSDAIHSVLELPNGDLLAAGVIYEQVGGGYQPGNPVWRWQGTAWSPLGGGIPGSVDAMVMLPDGRVVLGGWFQIPLPNSGTASNIVIWDGVGWQQLGSGVDGPVSDLAVRPDGSLVVCGRFNNAGGVVAPRVAQWDGTSWSSMGSVASPPSKVEVLANGDVVLVTYPTELLRWNGASWVTMNLPQQSLVRRLLALPNGDLFVATDRNVSGQPRQTDLLRWNGSSWSSLLPSGASFAPAGLTALARADGLLIGGSLREGDGRVAPLSRYESLCPATIVMVGTGCAGSNGVPDYEGVDLPWLGATYRARVDNLPGACLAVQVMSLGAAVSLPLPAVLRPTSPQCVLLVSPDIVRVQLASGSATTELAIPNVMALLGSVVRDQLVAIELDADSNIVGSSASAALEVTIGTY